MIKPVQEKTNSPNAYQEGYQQALDDFDISQLLLRLSNSLEKDLDVQGLDWQEQEIESLAALLIGQLTTSLKGSLATDYLNAIWHGEADMISRLPLIDVQLPEVTTIALQIQPICVIWQSWTSYWSISRRFLMNSGVCCVRYEILRQLRTMPHLMISSELQSGEVGFTQSTGLVD